MRNRRRDSDETEFAAETGGECGNVFERWTHVEWRGFEDGPVPHHIFARDEANQSGWLGGDRRAGKGNRQWHGSTVDRARQRKCRAKQVNP